ncbi:hypothetical protein NLN82_28680, partial [Citrobacter portucalensis]|nr:hypothetical protein [Citrobacter portucalensis]
MTNNKLTDKRQSLRKAAQDYQSTLSWYQENLDSPNAEQDCDEATAAFKREISYREMDIIADLLDEIDELREHLKNKIDVSEPEQKYWYLVCWESSEKCGSTEIWFNHHWGLGDMRNA